MEIFFVEFIFNKSQRTSYFSSQEEAANFKSLLEKVKNDKIGGVSPVIYTQTQSAASVFLKLLEG